MTSVAQIIHERRAEIMTLWVDEARAAASARGLSSIALENLMPSYLAALGDEHGGDDHVRAHLSTRLRQGFDLAEILDEFLALERSIAHAWHDLPGDQQPSASDIEHLHLQIHATMTEVTESFYCHMLEDEQSEKRHLRRLQALASEALHNVKTPLRDRMREVLEVIMEAMGAQCAAFHACDLS